MIDQKFETEASCSDYAKSESMSGTDDSVSSQPENNGRLECKKKLKKMRSIRLLRLSSMRSSTKREKFQYDNLSMLSSVGTESSGRPTPIEMSDASPNYMKATSSFNAKESLQSSQRLFTRKALTRMSSLKLRRSLTRKLSGATELKRKLKPARSIIFAAAKGLRSTRQLKSQCNANPLDSESNYRRDGQNRRSPTDYASNKSHKAITRRLSLKPVRILTKVSTSTKSTKSSVEEGPQTCRSTNSSLHKATYSSTLKDSHFPDHIDLPQEGSGSQGLSTMKICPYSYCSLHGLRHNDLPLLKRFVSMRRRLLKTQNSMKMESRPVSRSKYSGIRRKATQESQTVHSKDPGNKTASSGRSHFQKGKKLTRDSNDRHHGKPVSTLTGVGTSGLDDEEMKNFRYNAEVLLGETSFPHITFEEYLNNTLAVNEYPLFSFLAVKETNMECCCIATGEDKSDSKVTETAGNDENVDAHKKNDESAIVESESMNVVMSSASDIEILEEEIASKDKNMGPDNEVLRACSPLKEYVPPCTTDMASTVQEKDHKYIRLWHLIYKHAVLSNPEKGKNKLPFYGKDKEGGGLDALPSNGVNISCQDYCESETDQNMEEENKNVVELVQKAFDEILLPETEDLSANEQLKVRRIYSDEKLLEKSEGKSGERNTSTSRESPDEETCPKADNFRSHEEELTAQKLGAKPDQKTPKSWSNLKKLILLKRFVKALEKVRNFNIHRHGHLPSDANLEAEKVYLRHLTAEQKKNAEEWMLDYALQKVISKLAPAQKRRVALLVKAFETLPFQDAENSPQSSATVETQACPVQSLDDSLDNTKEETDKEMDYGYSAQILLQKASSSDNSITKYADNASHNPTPEKHNPIVLTERCLPRTETMKNIPASGAVDEDLNGKQSLARSCDNDEKSSIVNHNIHPEKIKDIRSCADVIMCSSHEEAPENELVNEVPQNLISNLNAEISNSKSESPGRDFETKNPVGVNGERFSMSRSLILKGIMRSLGSNLVSSGAPSDLLDEPPALRKERVAKAELENATHEESEAPKSAVVEPEKQNYTGLWYLVYKHMVSGIEANDSNPLMDGADEKGIVYDGSKTRGTSAPYESITVMKEDMHLKDHSVADPEVQVHQIEAIKMVEEAIDAVVPDDEEHLPDGKSFTDNTISDNSKKSNRTERVDSKDLNQKEDWVASRNEITEEQEEKPAPNGGNKPNQQLHRSWSNLKKVILLKRFIKALEKVRKFNPRGPIYLPMEPDSESEQVCLRHQEMAERKGTEEWMLDHALRQAVATLTPARKRKVALLVEAFETVMPTIKN